MLRAQVMLLLVHFPVFLSACVLLLVSGRWLIHWILRRHALSRLPGPRSRFLIGNLDLFAKETRKLESGSRTEAYFNVFRRLSQDHQPEGIYRFRYTSFKTIVALCNHETADVILSNSLEIDKSIQYHLLNNWLGESLLTSGGPVWRRKRQILSRVFHSKILKSFIPVLESNADRLCSQLASGASSRNKDILSLCLQSTLNTVMETTLGVNVNRKEDQDKDESDDYISALHQYCIYYIDRLSNPVLWIDPLYRVTRCGRQMALCVERMKSFTKKIIDQKIGRRQRQRGLCQTTSDTRSSAGKLLSREPEDESGDRGTAGDMRGERSGQQSWGRRPESDRGSLIQTLLQYFPLHEVSCEVDTFIFAGHDTTGLALFYTLLLIGGHEEVQQRLHQEIDDARDQGDSGPESQGRGGGGNISEAREEDELMSKKKTTFLDCVIRESLRLFPPVARIARSLNQEVLIRGSVTGLEYRIPEGTTVTIDIFQIQRNPLIFAPDPHSFRPERHEENGSRSDMSRACDQKVFMPFSQGPRSCIGSKFALMELKIFLKTILRRFKIISGTRAEQLNLAIEIVLKPKNENIQISFIER